MHMHTYCMGAYMRVGSVDRANIMSSNGRVETHMPTVSGTSDTYIFHYIAAAAAAAGWCR